MSTTNYGNPFQVRVLRDTTYWLSGSIITVRQIMDQGYEDVYEDSSGRKIERKDTCELIGIPMSTTNFTPWRYDADTRNVIAADGSIVCRNGDSVYGSPEIGALLTAAPELFEVCKRLAEFAAGTPSTKQFTVADIQGIVCDANQAIHKATTTKGENDK